MGDSTAIAWTDHTFNPWLGCERVSPACQHCYAEAWAKRSGLVEWGRNAERRVTSPANWRKPLAWNAAAEAAGRPALVFCASLADVFEDRPELVEPRDRLFELIEATPHLIWQLLTKRPATAHTVMFAAGWFRGEWPDLEWTGPPNVWIGTTVEDQQRAQERVMWLLSIPAPVRFLSCEPLLGPVDLTSINFLHQPAGHWPEFRLNALTGHVIGPDDVLPHSIDWVICGGESGPGHRPLELDHARALRDQCAGEVVDLFGVRGRLPVPYFFKQVGGRTPQAGGDLLDGVAHKAFPAVAQR